MPKPSKSRKESPRARTTKGAPTRKPAKKARRGAASKKVNGRVRRGTKQAILIEMLRRPNGATIEQMTAKTGWQAHSVRGAISGSLKKKLHLAVTSEKVEGRGRVSVANSYSRGDREFEKATAMLFPSKVAQRGRMRDHTAAPFRRRVTTADSNHIAPLARSVPVAGKRGFVGSTAAWQPVSAESLYPAIESARPRSRGGHKIRVISAQIEFLGGTAMVYVTMPRRHLLATDSWKIEGKKGIVGHGGCGKSVVRVERRIGNEFLHDSDELNYTRRFNIRLGVNNPGWRHYRTRGAGVTIGAEDAGSGPLRQVTVNV